MHRKCQPTSSSTKPPTDKPASMQNETVWLSLTDMSDLFQRDKSVISRHIRNLFAEGELVRDAVIANFATTAADGKTYQVEHFNLDVNIPL